ncbi:P-loop containing nucleoside triphosphate hydrolases superfamily protein [Rhynchospora pubera]|uniref:P-loop containing nucleoside triphosphate hydrolases superfamily protein n=1 Tax=Rhynchospora pubera TaxID=906938 RepID=A0AAV8BVY7_9POAL|nr:P-loop containing nucleoside triphosphate hydrolases superfamily protein [Rhynchospora pubera]
MGGSSTTEDDWELASINDAITLVLVGKLGYGKSATGNSIVGKNAFESSSDMNGVTCTCQMESTVISDGRKVNVIDTPGLFDWSVGSKEIGKEIVKCVKLAKDGIHAVILVFSIRSRFSEGEETILERLQMFFGERIVDYMILVFTGGDDLAEESKNFEEYLSGAPKPVKTIIKMCMNRVVLFNNRTKDQNEKDAQLQKLLFYVNRVIANNGGKPFSDKIFSKLKLEALKLHDEEKVIDNMRGQSAEQIAALKEEIYKSYNDQLTRITEMVTF